MRGAQEEAQRYCRAVSRAGVRGRVLAADDDRIFRDVLAEYILGDPALELVGMASNADEAIRLADFLQPDIALLDSKMPGGGGPRAAREIRKRSPRTRILALSGHEDPASVLDMLRAGAISYVVKSTMPGRVLPAIHDCLAGIAMRSVS